MPLLTCPFVSSSRSSAATVPQSPPVAFGPVQSPYLQKAFQDHSHPGVWPMACHLCSLTCPSSHTHVRSLTCFREAHLPPLRVSEMSPHQALAFAEVVVLRASPHCLRRPGLPSCPKRDFSGQGRVPSLTPEPQMALSLSSLSRSPQLFLPACTVSGLGHAGKHTCPRTPHTCSASSQAPFQILISRVLQTWELIIKGQG